ncbi:MAG: ASKHA domain-containing protein [Nitrososphaeria archaeon]
MIGLLPDVTSEKIKFVGNTAIAGSKTSLILAQIREYAESLIKLIDYCELAAEHNFQKEFIETTFIPHYNAN